MTPSRGRIRLAKAGFTADSPIRPWTGHPAGVA